MNVGIMAASLLNRLNLVKQRLDFYIAAFFGRGFPPGNLSFAEINLDVNKIQTPSPKFTIKDILEDGFLWAVPRNRRTIEKRLKRQFGLPQYVLKLMLPKTTIRTCNVCGDDHEVGVLCPTCYKKVIDETKVMQDAIQDKLGITPIDKEVVVLYNGEKLEADEHAKEKQVVEIKKSRPSWFSRNLLQGTTQQPATSTDVKPY